MHQQPPQAPRGPKSSSRSGQRSGVKGCHSRDEVARLGIGTLRITKSMEKNDGYKFTLIVLPLQSPSFKKTEIPRHARNPLTRRGPGGSPAIWSDCGSHG